MSTIKLALYGKQQRFDEWHTVFIFCENPSKSNLAWCRVVFVCYHLEFVGERVVAAQMELSPFSLQSEKDGFAKAAKELGVALVAYSPLGRGMASGR